MNPLIIAKTIIRQDADGRYCINDLHRAAGGKQKHRPKYWLENSQTKALIDEIALGGIPPTLIIKNVGTFVSKELIYAYGMWVSPIFFLHVVRTYDAIMMAEHDKFLKAQDRLKRSITKDKDCLSVVFKKRRNSDTHAIFKAMELLGLVRIVTEFRPVYRKEITESGWNYCSGYSKDGVIRIKPEMHQELVTMVKKVMDGNNTEVFS
jgi:hypothetical protein